MTLPSRHLLALWDYGWLDHNEFQLTACYDSQKLIESYLSSKYFGSSFVGPTLEETEAPELHGPFWRSKITVNDFQLIGSDEFYDRVQEIRQPTGFTSAASDEQWQAVNLLISKLKVQYKWFFNLQLTEQDSEKFHDWGFVLTIFREFLLANPDSKNVSTIIFGYD